jgi:hypothetical protein
MTLTAFTPVAVAQHGAPRTNATLSQIEDHYVTGAEHALLPVAEAMPDDKYSFAPSNGQFKGARTFADMVKHVAASNYGMASAFSTTTRQSLDSAAEVDAIAGKAEILKFLRGSFEFLHKALSTINQQNETELIDAPGSDQPLARLEVADRAVTHCWNHYGQLVEYLRIRGIKPPASH